MKNILLFGAGKSSTCLIDYLIRQAPKNKWILTLADNDPMLIRSKIGKSYYAKAEVLDVKQSEMRKELIQQADLVISLLPPSLHMLVARDCLLFKKHLLTASYMDAEIKKLEKDIAAAGILFLYEMGLDPGIDHMSAMQLIHSIERKGGLIYSFKSYCGGLVAPESDTNPWHYKIAWNPRNIVTAGMAGAVYKEKGKIKELDYTALFDSSRTVNISGIGKLAFYPNRDSLTYQELYHLQKVPTFMRATLRYPDFCEGWNALIKLGLTDEHHRINSNKLSFLKWAAQKFRIDQKKRLEENFAEFLGVKEKSKVIKQLKYLGLFNEELINQGEKSNADILQKLLEEKLKLEANDHDMVVMQHEIEFERRNLFTKMVSQMVVIGEDNRHTAMAKTVGLPLGIMAKLLLSGKISLCGLQIPLSPVIYLPVLKELETHGIVFEERFA